MRKLLLTSFLLFSFYTLQAQDASYETLEEIEKRLELLNEKSKQLEKELDNRNRSQQVITPMTTNNTTGSYSTRTIPVDVQESLALYMQAEINRGASYKSLPVIEELLNKDKGITANQTINVYAFYDGLDRAMTTYLLIRLGVEYSIIKADIKDFVTFITRVRRLRNADWNLIQRYIEAVNELDLRTPPEVLPEKWAVKSDLTSYKLLYLKKYKYTE